MNDRRFGGFGQIGQGEVDAVADFLGCHIGVFIKNEGDEDLRDAFDRCGAQLVYAADRVDGRFDAVGDFGFNLLRRRAGIGDGHCDGRQVDLREEINAERLVREETDDRQRQNQHCGEDGPAHTNFS